MNWIVLKMDIYWIVFFFYDHLFLSSMFKFVTSGNNFDIMYCLSFPFKQNLSFQCLNAINRCRLYSGLDVDVED